MRFRAVSSKAFVRNLYVSCLYKELGCFLFGCCVGQSLTNMAKLSVGRLRPHFLSVCGVTYASLNCTPGTYVATVSCRQPDHRLEEEARCVYVCVRVCVIYSRYVLGFCSIVLNSSPIFQEVLLLWPCLLCDVHNALFSCEYITSITSIYV